MKTTKNVLSDFTIKFGSAAEKMKTKTREARLKEQENIQNTHARTQKNQRCFITFISILKTTVLTTRFYSKTDE